MARKRRATVREAVDLLIELVYPVKKDRPVYVTRGEHKGFYRHPPNRHLNYYRYNTPTVELGFLAHTVVGLWAKPDKFAAKVGIDVNSPTVYAAITDWVGWRGPVPKRGISEQHITSLEVLAGKRQPVGPNHKRLLAKKGVTSG
jgi:hypothetical protein